jgi:hypothetical protein
MARSALTGIWDRLSGGERAGRNVLQAQRLSSIADFNGVKPLLPRRADNLPSS